MMSKINSNNEAIPIKRNYYIRYNLKANNNRNGNIRQINYKIKKKIPLRKISFNNNINDNNRNSTFNINLNRKYSYNSFNTKPQTIIFNFNKINNDNSNNITSLFQRHNLQQNRNNNIYYNNTLNQNLEFNMKFRKINVP